jgi:hypothetical protein
MFPTAPFHDAAPTRRRSPCGSVARAPPEDEESLLERLRAADASNLGDPGEGVIRVPAVSNEPRADDDTRPTAAGPAVHVHDASRSDLGVEEVEGRDQVALRGNREVTDRPPHVPDLGGHEVVVRLELAFLREVDEERDALTEHALHVLQGFVRPPGAGVSAGNEPALLDDRRRAHAIRSVPTCACRAAVAQDLPVYPTLDWPRFPGLGPSGTSPVRGSLLSGPRRRADRGCMASLETTTDAMRDRALMLSGELGIDPETWYLRVLEEGRADNEEADLGALVRAYWELQRVTGRADLRGEWRFLADRLWQD